MLRRMFPLLLIALAVMTMAMTAGCGFTRNKTGDKPASKPKATASTGKVTPKSESGIRVTRLDEISVPAGDINGIYLGDFIDAVDIKTGDPITEFGIDSPKWGSLKHFSRGHIRYYPPNSPGRDEVPITLSNGRGQTKDIVLQIRVTEPADSLPTKSLAPADVQRTEAEPRPNRQNAANQLAKSVRINSPENNAQIPKRICQVGGSAIGFADGTRITFYVRSIYGTVYPQGCKSEIYNNEFNGLVYLGDEQGNGIGEPFRVWAKTQDGKLSNTITLNRTQ